MMPAVAAESGRGLKGRRDPTMAPPLPARSLLREWKDAAAAAGIKPLPWQEIAARYMMATTAGRSWAYPDVCIAAARQNGKTALLVPRILHDLRSGRRTLHIAHRMRVSSQVFRVVAPIAQKEGARLRLAQGQEEVFHPSGGTYAIVAALRGARGDHCDTLIVDEAREFEDTEAMEAAGPTVAASQNGQTIFLSNAGSDASIILNALRRRGEDGDPTIAYVEWAAGADRSIDDIAGWAEANPSLGHFPGLFAFLQKQRAAYEESPAVFETEHLCRWVRTMLTRVVGSDAWARCHADTSEPERPAMAFNMDPGTTRAAAAIAWRMADGRIGLRQLLDARGAPLDTEALGLHLRKTAIEHRVRRVGFASWTDAALARGWKQAKALDGKEFAAACAVFVELVNSGRLAWDGEELIGDDLAFTTRKPHESGAWVAVPASVERPTPAALAAIRAVYLASERPNLPRIG